MNPAIEKVKKLVAKHKKRVAPLMNKDEPAVARPDTKDSHAVRRKSRWKFHVTDVVEAEGTSDKIPIDRNERDERAAYTKKKKFKDGAVMIDPDENMIGNPGIPKDQQESLVNRYKKYLEENQ